MEKIIELRNKPSQYPRLFKCSKITIPKINKSIDFFHIHKTAYKNKNIIPIFAKDIFISNDNKIIIRGYDMFFNIGEIEDTRWENIETKTVGPYELTLKLTGFTIYVSVFNDELCITTDSNNNNYTNIGKKWLFKYIKNNQEALIDFIKENNITLIFELKDDKLDEHIFECDNKQNGLYLHGINTNTTEFNTWSCDKVAEIAKKFNFPHVEYKIFNDIKELKKFADSVNGYYNENPIEGWVVRCKQKDGNIFFFKYIYDEPYLLYREWKEATKAYANNKSIKYTFIKTYNYIEWIKENFTTKDKLYTMLQDQNGIIKLRNQYLNDCKEKKYIEKEINLVTKETAKYKLVLPISVMGFGKTTIIKMINILYNINEIYFSNTKNNNALQEFITNITNEFENRNILFANMSNHMKKSRYRICEKLKTIYPNNLWIIALNWNIDTTPEKDILSYSRYVFENKYKDYHQNFIHFLRMFLINYDNLDVKNNDEDKIIDEVVEINYKDDPVSITKQIIKALDLEPKSDEEIEKALTQVNEIKHEIINSKNVLPLYYGLRMKYVNCKDLALKYIKIYSEQNNKYITDCEHIKHIIDDSNFIQREHVTLFLRKESSPEKLKYYDDLIGEISDDVINFNNSNLEVIIHVSSIVWTSNLVFMPVDEIETDKLYNKEKIKEKNENNNNDENNDNNNNNDDDNNKKKKKKNKYKNSNENYHITLGCFGDAKPVECNHVLQKINEYYQKNADIKPPTIKNEDKILVDESFLINEINKDKENEIKHPKTMIHLLPPSIENTSFMKPIKIVEGPDWKQLFFEPFKFKAYFTKFFY